MPATRTTRAAAAAKAGRPKLSKGTGNSASSSSSKTKGSTGKTNTPQAATGPPPKIILLPSDQAQSPYNIISLPHPRTKVLTRYLLHPTRNALLYEITKVKEPASKKRSWLIHNPELAETLGDAIPPRGIPAEEDDGIESEGEGGGDEGEGRGLEDNQESNVDTDGNEAGGSPDYKAPGHIFKEALLYVTTPIDVLYLLLPHLLEGRTSRNFITLEDFFESHPQAGSWTRMMKASADAERMVHSRIRAVCDTVSVGDEDMYRLSTDKVLGLLHGRLNRMAEALPASLKALVTSQLAKPLKSQLSVMTNPSTKTDDDDGANSGVIDDKQLEEEVKAETGEGQSGSNTPAESQKSQVASLRAEDSALSTASELAKETDALTLGPSQTITAEAVVQHDPPPPNVEKLANIAQALSFIVIYIPSSLRTSLTDHVNKLHPPEELDEYLAELKKLRAEAAAAIEASMLHTKRTLEDIEGGARDKHDAEQEKKRRKKEEDARKSSGVKKLEKVNTKGMAKMTSFFKKKE